MHTFLTDQQIDSYYKNGFLLLEQIYSLSTITQIRSAFEKDYKGGGWKTAPYYNEGISTNIYKRMPHLVPLIFNQKFMLALKDLFGANCHLLPEPAVHKNRYYYWHKDSTFLDEQRQGFHWRDDFEAAMTVLYLQDNDPISGGGLTVIPGSHKKEDQYWSIPTMNMLERAILKLQKITKTSFFDKLERDPTKYFIPSKVGDAIILDMRIDHKGSPIKTKKKLNQNKYGIMNIACKGGASAKRISDCLKNRPSDYYHLYLKKEKHISQEIVEIAKHYNIEVLL